MTRNSIFLVQFSYCDSDVDIIFTRSVYCSQVNCYGSGLQPNGLVQGKPAEFTVDTKKAGNAPLDVKVMDHWSCVARTRVHVTSNKRSTDYSKVKRFSVCFGQTQFSTTQCWRHDIVYIYHRGLTDLYNKYFSSSIFLDLSSLISFLTYDYS